MVQLGDKGCRLMERRENGVSCPGTSERDECFAVSPFPTPKDMRPCLFVAAFGAGAETRSKVGNGKGEEQSCAEKREKYSLKRETRE